MEMSDSVLLRNLATWFDAEGNDEFCRHNAIEFRRIADSLEAKTARVGTAHELVTLIIYNTCAAYSIDVNPEKVYTKEELIEIVRRDDNDKLREFVNWYNEQPISVYIPNSLIGQFNLYLRDKMMNK